MNTSKEIASDRASYQQQSHIAVAEVSSTFLQFCSGKDIYIWDKKIL